MNIDSVVRHMITNRKLIVQKKPRSLPLPLSNRHISELRLSESVTKVQYTGVTLIKVLIVTSVHTHFYFAQITKVILQGRNLNPLASLGPMLQ
jgi:hypothetical protein